MDYSACGWRGSRGGVVSEEITQQDSAGNNNRYIEQLSVYKSNRSQGANPKTSWFPNSTL